MTELSPTAQAGLREQLAASAGALSERVDGEPARFSSPPPY